MMTKTNRDVLSRILVGTMLLAVPGGIPGLRAAESDIRRDAVVEAVEKALPSVVTIRTETIVARNDPYERMLREFWGPSFGQPWLEKHINLGSGVIIDEEGWVLTNFHVADRATGIFIKLADGRELEAEPVAGTSFADIAVLRIKTKKPERFKAIRLATDDDLLLGETVLAIGNPFGLGGSVSRGILSSKSRRPPRENQPLEIEDWLQTDAAINPGNSGGPLINLRGELIGVNVAVHQEGQGIGFAIPVKRVSAALAHLYSPELTRDDRKPIWFGALVTTGPLPLKVRSVEPESPAAQAGLLAGDVILKIEGRAPRNFIDFSTEVIRRSTNDPSTCSLLVERGGQSHNLTIRMTPLETFFNTGLVRKKIGLTVQQLTPSLAEAFGMPAAKGLLVSDVQRGTPADRAGLQQGMVVTAIDRQSCTQVTTLARKLNERRKDDKVVLDVLVPRQRGFFVQIQQVSVELTVR
jgi:serine protease Do